MIKAATPKLDAEARRTAKGAGFIAKKSRRSLSIDNLGGYNLIDPQLNAVVAGGRFDLTATDVIEFCRGYIGAAIRSGRAQFIQSRWAKQEAHHDHASK